MFGHPCWSSLNREAHLPIVLRKLFSHFGQGLPGAYSIDFYDVIASLNSERWWIGLVPPVYSPSIFDLLHNKATELVARHENHIHANAFVVSCRLEKNIKAQYIFTEVGSTRSCNECIVSGTLRQAMA
jgi:hypothetical protein